ncbi:MAG: PadR family transcriptional regulator [Leucobacter sp.]
MEQDDAQVHERIATNIRKGVLEYCVLALLARRDMYGLELANELMQRSLSASEGSLYPLLARMREAGAVETRWDLPETGRARRYYRITAHGRSLLGLFAGIWEELAGEVGALIEVAPDRSAAELISPDDTADGAIPLDQTAREGSTALPSSALQSTALRSTAPERQENQ